MPKGSFTYKALNRQVGKALHHYQMIEDGDRILVGVSGGKDSLSLLWILTERLRRVPLNYTLFPVYIDPGFKGSGEPALQQWLAKQDIVLRVEATDYGLRAHGAENGENPCFLCSRLRRKRLFEIADQLECRKIALGHTKDDIIETFFLNVCYAGEISTMNPKQGFFRNRFQVIRPLAYVDEAITEQWATEMQFPLFENPCPSAKVSKRAEIKKLLHRLYVSNNKIKGNIFRSLHHVKPEYLL